MGLLLLVLRLAVRDLRRRPAQAALLTAAIAAASTTLALGLLVRGVADDPWERTRAATAGPDAVATSSDAAALRRLAGAPGARETAGPYPTLSAELRSGRVAVRAVVQGRDAAPGDLDRPLLAEGRWPAATGAAAVEQSFARALKVRPGDRITLAGRTFRVAGIAITSGRVPYPSATPGLVFTGRADAARLPSGDRRLTMPVRLADPAAAPAFAAAHPGVRSWQDMGAYATSELHLANGALLGGTWAMAILAGLCVALVAGGRLAEQGRRVGLLKAAGATPVVVAAMLLVEHLAIAVAGAAAGLCAGWAAAPALSRPGAGLLDGADPVPTPGIAAAVLLAALAVTAAATAVPAVRGARISAARALVDPVRPPRRSRLAGAAAALPVPLLLGVRAAARRPRRTLLAGLSMAVTVAMTVAALAMRQDVARKDAGATGPDFVAGAGNPVTERVSQVALALSLALLLLAAVNAILTAWATSLDSARTAALARALGATPRQVTAGLSVAQLLPAAAAAVAGIPLGHLVHAAALALAGGEGGSGGVPPPMLAAVVPATLLAVALLTAIPIRYAATKPVAAVLGRPSLR